MAKQRRTDGKPAAGKSVKRGDHVLNCRISAVDYDRWNRVASLTGRAKNRLLTEAAELYLTLLEAGLRVCPDYGVRTAGPDRASQTGQEMREPVSDQGESTSPALADE